MNGKHQIERYAVTWSKREMLFSKAMGDNVLLSLPSPFLENNCRKPSLWYEVRSSTFKYQEITGTTSARKLFWQRTHHGYAGQVWNSQQDAYHSPLKKRKKSLGTLIWFARSDNLKYELIFWKRFWNIRESVETMKKLHSYLDFLLR